MMACLCYNNGWKFNEMNELFAIAKDSEQHDLGLIPKMSNRHGLIAGATGTGKTVTLRKMAECFSDAGIPVFLLDVKGDLSGIADAGENSGFVAKRMQEFGLQDAYLHGFRVRYWDVFAQQGLAVRITISEMGPVLLSHLMGLNDTQSGLLSLVFKVADDKAWHLIDLKDLRGMLKYVSEHAKEFRATYGNVSAASVGAIQRQLLQLEQDGADLLFGEPDINLDDLLQTQGSQGVINLLQGERLMRSPRIFSAFLLWLLAQLFERLPEVGDLPQPKLVLFFDEAHLLFDQAEPALLQQIEQVVRLIRSKGVGVYFVTQNPLDLPDTILGQLGNRVQHALRAFTPRDQKAVKAAAETFRSNPNLNVTEVISELATGEALVSFLDEKGMPTPVERALILPPSSALTPKLQSDVGVHVQNDDLYAIYQKSVDRYSAYEAILAYEEGKVAPQTENTTQATPATAQTKTDPIIESPGLLDGLLTGLLGGRRKSQASLSNKIGAQLGHSISNEVTKSISRTIMGIIKGK